MKMFIKYPWKAKLQLQNQINNYSQILQLLEVTVLAITRPVWEAVICREHIWVFDLFLAQREMCWSTGADWGF